MIERKLPEPNIPLLRKVVEWAEAEAAKPLLGREWNQGNWAVKLPSCGTAFCIAGKAVFESIPDAELRPGTFIPVHLDLYVDGVLVSWEEKGMEVLGLTEREADALFSGGNDIETVRHYAEWIAQRAGDRL